MKTNVSLIGLSVILFAAACAKDEPAKGAETAPGTATYVTITPADMLSDTGSGPIVINVAGNVLVSQMDALIAGVKVVSSSGKQVGAKVTGKVICPLLNPTNGSTTPTENEFCGQTIPAPKAVVTVTLDEETKDWLQVSMTLPAGMATLDGKQPLSRFNQGSSPLVRSIRACSKGETTRVVVDFSEGIPEQQLGGEGAVTVSGFSGACTPVIGTPGEAGKDAFTTQLSVDCPGTAANFSVSLAPSLVGKAGQPLGVGNPMTNMAPNTGSPIVTISKGSEAGCSVAEPSSKLVA